MCARGGARLSEWVFRGEEWNGENPKDRWQSPASFQGHGSNCPWCGVESASEVR